ncbi:MAG TPA: hypothetical protein VHP83_22315 [Aggregatilineaceae bacterium]|nr:hypothetical protein [Aggregatilineaceae bacterium]
MLLDHIDTQTHAVMSGERSLDQALAALDRWFEEHADTLSEGERQAFSAALDRESSEDDRSLIDSVLKLHTTRLLYRYDNRKQPPPEEESNPYTIARDAFSAALKRSERGINEARIDIAIANAHQLLGDQSANRRWLDTALNRLPDLAAINLADLAEKIPPMPPPKMGRWQRIGLKVMGVDLSRLADDNRQAFSKLAHMQINQLVILAHLVGISLEAIKERQLSKRAFRIAAHLIVRYEGLTDQEPDQLLDIAESLLHPERDAALILARQAYHICATAGDEECMVRAKAVLEQGGQD